MSKEFKVVSDDLRDNKQKASWSERNKVLKAGKTIFVPLNGRSDNSVRATSAGIAQRNGYDSHSTSAEIDGEKGVVLWWEKR